MPELKLAELPERSPLKLTITVGPDLYGAIWDYADIYATNYGQQEKIEDLIAFMLQQFIEGDLGFAKPERRNSRWSDGHQPDAAPRPGENELGSGEGTHR